MADGNGGQPPRVFRQYARALVIAAHPDDPEFLFGATIASLVADGTAVRYVICSDGANGQRNLALTNQEVAETRAREQRAAAESLGVAGVTFLGFPDGRLESTLSLRAAIAREIRRERPDLVLTHYPKRVLELPLEASHPDHVAVGDATLAAIFPDATNGRAYPDMMSEGLPPHRVREVWIPGYEQPNHYVDASALMERKNRAILCHKSQLEASQAGEVPPWVADFMRRVGTAAGYEYAEHYRRLRTG
jgi:LmbE family N-acetylglucosaminyl deacetylase